LKIVGSSESTRLNADRGKLAMRKPTPSPRSPDAELPHKRDREGQQPYARELDDYQHGVAAPPEEQTGRTPNPEPRGKRAKK